VISAEVKEKLRSAKKVAVLTGAGVSAESGVPTFRGEEGLWKNFRAEELATPEAFNRDPKLVWQWYDWRRTLIADLKPNPGHYALAELEKRYDDFTLITQNVDGLHEAAGSKNIVELHGNIWRLRCTVEGKITSSRQTPLGELPPLCECGAMLRPHIVWFGESLEPDVLQKAFAASRACDVFIVEPAASLAGLAADAGAFVIEVNPDETPITDIVSAHLHGKSGKVLPLLLET